VRPVEQAGTEANYQFAIAIKFLNRINRCADWIHATFPDRSDQHPHTFAVRIDFDCCSRISPRANMMPIIPPSIFWTASETRAWRPGVRNCASSSNAALPNTMTQTRERPESPNWPTRSATFPVTDPYISSSGLSRVLACHFICGWLCRMQNRHWDENRSRPAVGEAFPLLLFRLQDGFTVPP